MKTSIGLLMALFSFSTLADWQSGIDQKDRECKIQISGPSGQSQRRLPLYEVDFVLNKVQYLGVLVEVQNGTPLPFNTTLIERDNNIYSQLHGIPITIFGIGLRTVSGQLLMNAQNEIDGAKVEVAGGVFGKKEFTCELK